MTSALHCIGGELVLRELVETFYDRMETDPEAYPLHRLHFRGHGLNHTRQSQFEFLSGFLGGRAYYREAAAVLENAFWYSSSTGWVQVTVARRPLPLPPLLPFDTKPSSMR